MGNTGTAVQNEWMPWQTPTVMNQRIEFAMKSLQTDNFRALCREYGISTKVGYKWRGRFLAEGIAGLGDVSRRPKRSPAALSEEEVCRIVRLKERHRHWGPRKLQELYLRQWGVGPSESSFKRVLERCGLTEKRRIRSAATTGRIASGRRASAPNEVWTVDFKGWWYDKEGKCNPLTVRDEYSRYLLEMRALADARTATVRSCFERLFSDYGVPGAIRSDNGSPFGSHGLLGLSRLSAWWIANGIDLERSRPGCPQDNGAHERLHRAIAMELECAPYPERQAALDTWREEFNTQRPHEALGLRCPAEVYRRSEQRWAGTPDRLVYERALIRRVHHQGFIRYRGEVVFVSESLAGWDVGLRPRQDLSYDLYFARLLLGRLEPHTAAFIPITKLAQSAGEEDEP